MNTWIHINGKSFDAIIIGTRYDREWNNRDSKAITVTMDYATAAATFFDDVPWSILYQPTEYYDPETQQMVTPPVEEYDNSDYCILGDITVHRDGTVTVKMGKPTADEINQILMEAMQG